MDYLVLGVTALKAYTSKRNVNNLRFAVARLISEWDKQMDGWFPEARFLIEGLCGVVAFILKLYDKDIK